MKMLRFAATLAVMSLLITASIPSARTITQKTPIQSSGHPTPRTTNDRPLATKSAFAGAMADTFIIAEYGFENTLGGCDSQGWYSVDITQQPGPFFHVDDLRVQGAAISAS